MISIKVKKRIMYIVFGFIFLFGGIEYAVILPTLWLYLHNEYNAPEYMLGMVLAAYSLAAFISSPIFGRVIDRTRNTKLIIIICTLFELGGSFLYFTDISVWMCVLSRFISGLGAASEAIVFAEVSRYTTVQERTGIISKLAAIRQIALLLGPGFNVFLRIADFKIGPFFVNKYTSPAAFMVIMWTLLLTVVICLYMEPAKIYAQEKFLEDAAAIAKTAEIQEAHDGSLNHDNESLIPNSEQDRDNDTGEETIWPDQNVSESNLVPRQWYDTHTKREPENYDSQFSYSKMERKFSEPCPVVSDRDPNHSTNSFSPNSKEKYQNKTQFPETAALGSSLDIMVSAEAFIYSSQCKGNNSREGTEEAEYMQLTFDEHHFDCTSDLSYHFTDNNVADERTPLLAGGSGVSKNQTNAPYINRSSQVLDDPIAREGKLGFFCNEYIRDEIIAIIYLLFCAMFSQVCVETMVTPLALKYMDFGELENSLLYCACGVEIIIVFVVVTLVSRCVSDRNMLFFGLTTVICSNIWLLYYLPQAPPHDLEYNLPQFSIAVFLDVLSLPFLFVCSTSLYSKLTRPQTQGLSQGVRRSVVGLGNILAPMWGSSTVNQPYFLFGVLVGMQSLAMVLMLMSYKRMKPINFHQNEQDHQPIKQATISSEAQQEAVPAMKVPSKASPTQHNPSVSYASSPHNKDDTIVYT